MTAVVVRVTIADMAAMAAYTASLPSLSAGESATSVSHLNILCRFQNSGTESFKPRQRTMSNLLS